MRPAGHHRMPAWHCVPVADCIADDSSTEANEGRAHQLAMCCLRRGDRPAEGVVLCRSSRGQRRAHEQSGTRKAAHASTQAARQPVCGALCNRSPALACRAHRLVMPRCHAWSCNRNHHKRQAKSLATQRAVPKHLLCTADGGATTSRTRRWCQH